MKTYLKKISILFVLTLYSMQVFAAGNVTGGPLDDETRSLVETQAQQQVLSTQSLADSRLNTGASVSSFKKTVDGLPIYGSQLFQGDFGDLSFSGFNPNYQIGVGDEIQLLIWGAMTEELQLTVDAKGNVFIPSVGPINVLGVRNDTLNQMVQKRIQQVYKDNVESYANLKSTQTVKIFVSGHVMKPGLYHGFASDSVLHYLDQAGGVDPERGSYLKVSLVRADTTIQRLDLYEFLQHGKLPLTQFRDGDVILIEPRSNTVSVTGKVVNSARFEFVGDTIPLTEVLEYAQLSPAATSVSVRRVRDGQSTVQVCMLAEVDSVLLQSGDVVHVTGRGVVRNVLISFTGEFEGLDSRVFPAGTKLSEVVELLKPTKLSNIGAAQLFRKSVADRQAALIQQSLDHLERKVMTASSVSLEEAKLRQVEAQTISSFIARARQAEPTGQIMMASLEDAEQVYIQDGDVLHIPRMSNLVTVHGEVQYPNTQLYRENESVADYIDRAGGFTRNANEKELILVKANGMIETIGKGRWVDPEPSDEIIVLPKADAKKLMYAKEISTIIYQIALGARVVIGL
jgi:protein involved in polysaccharide export with SLBB domain